MKKSPSHCSLQAAHVTSWTNPRGDAGHPPPAPSLPASPPAGPKSAASPLTSQNTCAHLSSILCTWLLETEARPGWGSWVHSSAWTQAHSHPKEALSSRVLRNHGSHPNTYPCTHMRHGANAFPFMVSLLPKLTSTLAQIINCVCLCATRLDSFCPRTRSHPRTRKCPGRDEQMNDLV